MTTNAFRVWSERLDTGTLTKSQVQQFAGAISTVALGRMQRGRHSALTHEECVSLYRRIRSQSVRLTDDHTRQGHDWLSRYGAKVLAMDSETHSAMMLAFDHFSWDGQIVDGSVLPIWTVHLTTGAVLQYFNASWVSKAYDNERDSAYWWGIRDSEPIERSDYDYLDSFADAERVSVFADNEIDEWNSFVDGIRERTKSLRGKVR